MNGDLFDNMEGDRLKKEGMKLASDNREDELAIGRKIGIAVALRKGTCNADDVGRILKEQYGISSLGPASGSLFKGPEWVFTGRRVKSRRTTNHSRELKEWRLSDEYLKSIGRLTAAQ